MRHCSLEDGQDLANALAADGAALGRGLREAGARGAQRRVTAWEQHGVPLALKAAHAAVRVALGHNLREGDGR